LTSNEKSKKEEDKNLNLEENKQNHKQMISNANPKFFENLNHEKPIRHLDTEQFNAGKDLNVNRKSQINLPNNDNKQQPSNPNNYNSEDKGALTSKKKDGCMIW
jgi:hypothetical protein